MKKFWNWVDKVNPETPDESVGVLQIYGTIAESSWFDDDVTPAIFREELEKHCGKNIEVYINSPGGDCIAASQIYTMLLEYKGHVTVKIDGVAASAASVIAMAGSTVLMAPTAMMMIHNPMTMAFGDHNEMEACKKMLSEVKESIINAYHDKTNLPHDEISRMMENETSAYVPTVAANAYTVAFGDFSYYWIADRQNRTMKRLNELYATNGQVGFVSTQRVDGKIILAEGIKLIKQHA